MSDATCKTCPWWHSPSEKCRCNPPTVVPTRRTRAQATSSQWTEYSGSGYCPHTTADFWCGEHPGRQGRIECAEATLVTSETSWPTAADMRRVIAALEKMATCAARVTP